MPCNLALAASETVPRMSAAMGSFPDHMIVTCDHRTHPLAKYVFGSCSRQNVDAFCMSCTFKPCMWCSPAEPMTKRYWHRLQRLHRKAIHLLLLAFQFQVYMAYHGRSQRATLAGQFPQGHLLIAISILDGAGRNVGAARLQTSKLSVLRHLNAQLAAEISLHLRRSTGCRGLRMQCCSLQEILQQALAPASDAIGA